MKKLVTHNQGFHADDVMAYAILQEVLTKRGEVWEITRTRDYDLIANGDIVFDTGNEYDATRNRFDHHQRERAGARENGVLYASAGLIWKHFGHELCSDEVWKEIDQKLISSLDASDNGQDIITEYAFPNMKISGLGNFIAHFEPTMFETKTPEGQLEAFEKAAAFARGVLQRMIHDFEAIARAFSEATEIYKNADNKELLVFQKNYERPTWKRLANFPEPIFAIYPNEQVGGWKVEAVPKNTETLEARKNAPESWRGMRDAELQQITGVADAAFCHPSGFLFGAKSFEGAMELAKKALLM